MVIALAQILLSGYNSMTKIMSVSLTMFLYWNSQVMCSERLDLQRIVCSGNSNFKSLIVDRDAEIKLTGNSHYLECDVLPSVRKIRIEMDTCNCSQAILHMPFFGEMPKVTCRHDTSNASHVTIYSFKDVKINYTDDTGNDNSCRVVSPLRRLIAPVAVVGGIGFIYWMIWGKS